MLVFDLDKALRGSSALDESLDASKLRVSDKLGSDIVLTYAPHYILFNSGELLCLKVGLLSSSVISFCPKSRLVNTGT